MSANNRLIPRLKSFLKRIRASHIVICMFVLRILMPLFYPVLRFGVLRCAEFFTAKLLGHSVKEFIFRLAVLLMGRNHSEKLLKLLNRVTELADGCMNDCLYYFLIFTVPALILAVSAGMYAVSGHHPVIKRIGKTATAALLLARAVACAAFVPACIFANAFLKGESELEVFPAVLTAGAVTAAISAVYHFVMFLLTVRNAGLLRGLAASLCFTAAFMELVPKLMNLRFYSEAIVPAFICTAFYLILGGFILKKKK